GFVGCRVRGARSAPLRVGAALGPAVPRGDRADSGMGVRRDQDVSVPSGGGLGPSRGGGAGGNAMAAARELSGAARHAAFAAGQAAVVAHVAAHELGAAAYAIKAVRAAALGRDGESAGRLECRWQREQLPDVIRELVLEDQRLRNEICWSVFDG